MASNSKKRRRVLGVSCILAALIIASSSFAWFTSKDEVTNRLSASADYNVSIIENFAPPKQFVPGQTVTKEEAVVNTGSIDAFVKQTISGVMTVTVPVATGVKPEGSEAAKYITLNEKEAGSIEAGSYLAWAPAGSAHTKGEKVVYAFTPTDDSNAPTGDFVPDVEGLYIFRRAVIKDDATDSSKDTKYDYVGYYYVPGTSGTYYKLHNSSLVVAPSSIDTNGDLKAEPTYKFSKKVTKTLNKVPMEYQSAQNRLKVAFNAEASTDTSSIASLDREVYDALRNKLDYEKGKTNWAMGSGTADAAGNTTGLTTYDNLYDYSADYDNDTDKNNAIAADSEVKDDMSNWSQERLASRLTETQNAVKNASPPNRSVSGAMAEPVWTGTGSPYADAVDERKVINEGIMASKELDTQLWDLIALIGGPTAINNGAVLPNNGLVMVTTTNTGAADTHEWKTYLTENDLVPTVTLTTADMTQDNLDEAAYADKDFSVAPYNCTVPDTNATEPNFGSKIAFTVTDNPYATGVTASTSTLAATWDEVVGYMKQVAVLDKKIELCDTSASGYVTVTTNVGRTSVEADEYRTMLDRQKADVIAKLGDATATGGPAEGTALYRLNQLKGEITTALSNINANQTKVDNANAKYYDYYSATGGNSPQGVTYTKPVGVPNGKAFGTGATNTVTAAVNLVVDGTKDAPKEDTMEDDLKRVYGVAYRDVSPQAYADGVTYEEIYTYSPDQTKGRIDASLTANTSADPTVSSTNGIIQWQTSTTDGYETVPNADRADIQNKPYYQYKKVDFMKQKRDNDVDSLNTIYADLAAKRGIAISGSSASGDVIIYVNLDNLNDAGSVADKWQHLGTSTTDYDFFYTGILQSGETSSRLIKSITFDESVKQDSFLDLDFDLNVALQSAQAVYQGDDIILPTSANATLSGGKTTGSQYGIDSVVTWEADTTDKTANAPTNNDPNPKANDIAVPTTP